MKPVKNVSFRHFDIGSEWQGRRITGLQPCTDSESCKHYYRNFDIACGGDRRVFTDSPFREARCIFFTAGEDYLASERYGRPIE